MIQHGVSIIICCHNGASRLPETIKHIALQRVPFFLKWEFILVDNASTDNSVSLVEAIWSVYQPTGQFKVVHEPRLGLTYARAKGFDEAQYEFVVMCDDDNWLAPDFAQLAYDIMRDRPKIGALGSLGKLVYEFDPPKYIEYSNIFAAGPQAPQSGRVKNNRLYGAGCVIRKSAYLKLKELGFKSFLEDRKGVSLSSGGDHELCYALAISGFDIWYDERLRFSHYITKERLTWDYFIRYACESAVCFDVLTSYKMVASDFSTYKFTFLSVSRDFVFCIRRFLKINALRIFTASGSVEGKVLYFKHVILKNKILAFVSKYHAMARNHREILKFKEACVRAQLIKQPVPQDAATRLKFIFSLGLYRQPQ
jgi:glycosyltransferase involved in cell wall biosynthesis